MRVFFVLVLPFSPLWVFAQSILINEIAWMGTPVVGVEEKQWWRYEWLELYNSSDTAVSLDGWKIELSRDKLDFSVSLNGTIAPKEYYIAGASDKIPNLDLNYKNLGGKFNNSGQRVVLRNALGETIDEVNALSGRSGSEESSGSMSWPAGDNKTKQTMERVVGASQAEALAKAWQTSAEPGGTPKSPNSDGKLNSVKFNLTELSFAQKETEKDPIESFQSRVPIVNPITLLAGLLALGFSGVLLLVKRSLALRQNRRT